MPDSCARLLNALASLTAREPRPEAQSTVKALRAGHLPSGQPPCALAAEIRKIAIHPGALPEARLVPEAEDCLPWGISPLGRLQTAAIGAIKAVATILGPDGAPIRDNGLMFGLFYQCPESYYPLHDHLADETYIILAGTALWTAGDDQRWRGPGDMIHHPSRMPHAFRAGPLGFLATWRWSGDISFDSYRLLSDPAAEV